jgi:hypothetical protein
MDSIARLDVLSRVRLEKSLFPHIEGQYAIMQLTGLVRCRILHYRRETLARPEPGSRWHLAETS